MPWWNELSECGKKGLAVKPKMGDALLFWSMRPDATLDPSSLHGLQSILFPTFFLAFIFNCYSRMIQQIYSSRGKKLSSYHKCLTHVHRLFFILSYSDS